MKTINADIKNNQFKNIYLLSGEEVYLKKQYRDKLKNALIDADDNMNYSYYEGNKINSVELLDTGETLPFFAERRVVIIENSGYFKSAPDNFLERLTGFPDSTYVIFVESEIDKRSKLYKKIKDIGYVADFSTPDANMLSTWIGGLCKAENKQISQATVNYMLEVIGMDMTTIKFELEKLFSYAYGREVITIEDINEVCVSQATSKIFDMLDAIGNKNREKALTLYRDLLELKEPAMRILYLITRQYNILLQVRGILDSGKDQSTIAKVVGVPPFAVKKYVAQAKSYSYKTLLEMLDLCQDTDYRVKTGRIVDVIGVELLIVGFSNK